MYVYNYNYNYVFVTLISLLILILQSQPEAIECLQLHLSHRLKLYPTHT